MCRESINLRDHQEVWSDETRPSCLHKSRRNNFLHNWNWSYSDLDWQDISPEEFVRNKDRHASHVKKMNAEIKKLEDQANRIGRQRKTAKGDKKAELAVTESTME